MNKLDVLFLSHGRPKFTAAALRTLCRNTSRDLIERVYIFTDGDKPPGFEQFAPLAGMVEFNTDKFGGPVAIMNAFLRYRGRPEVFAKIDNDTIVPPGWLEPAAAVMHGSPDLHLLGIEPPASRTPSKLGAKVPPKPELCGSITRLGIGDLGYAPSTSIGGIGLMRRSAWRGRPPMVPFGFNGVGGFTNWQTSQPGVNKAWMMPPLRVFLLDRLPCEPWSRLSAEYVKRGDQRPWSGYSVADSWLWDWWTVQPATERPLLSVHPALGGWDALLACGHLVHSAVKPGDRLPCGACVSDFLDDARA